MSSYMASFKQREYLDVHAKSSGLYLFQSLQAQLSLHV